MSEQQSGEKGPPPVFRYEDDDNFWTWWHYSAAHPGSSGRVS